MNRSTIGRWLFSLNAVLVGGGGFLADLNGTHLYNPRWPPHARFHDGQTMAVGLLFALALLFFAWRRGGDRPTNVLATTIFAGLLCVSQAAANLFPAVAWADPEFLQPGQRLAQVAPSSTWMSC